MNKLILPAHLQHSLSRRSVLKGAAGVGAFALGGSALTSCSSDSGGSGGDSRKTIRFWDYVPEDFPTSKVLTGPLREKFRDKYPDLDIEFTFDVNQAQMSQKVTQAIAQGQAPDIFFNYYSKGELESQGYLEPLDPVLAEAGLTDDFYPGALDMVRIDDNVIMLPGIFGVKCPLYRKDFLAEAGLDPNSPPTNWEEFGHAAEVLTLRDSGGKITRDGFSWYTPEQTQEYTEKIIIAMMQNSGTEFETAAADAASSIQSEASAAGFSWHLDLIREHRCQDVSGPFTTTEQFPMPAGLAGIDLQGPWWLNSIRKDFPEFDVDELLVVGMPLKEQAQVGLGAAQGYSVYSGSDLKDEALDLMAMWISDEIYAEYHEVARYPTARQSINNAPSFWMADEPFLAPGSSYYEALQFPGNVGLNHLAYNEIADTVYAGLVERALAGEGSDADLLAEAAAAADEITATRVRELGL